MEQNFKGYLADFSLSCLEEVLEFVQLRHQFLSVVSLKHVLNVVQVLGDLVDLRDVFVVIHFQLFNFECLLCVRVFLKETSLTHFVQGSFALL